MSLDVSGRTITAAIALHRAGATAKAVALCESLLAFDPNDCEALKVLGALKAEVGDFAAAAALFQRSLRGQPAQAECWIDLSSALSRLGKFEEALAASERALSLNPKAAPAWVAKGNALSMQGALPEAEAAYDRALRADPAHPVALQQRGIVRAAMGNAAAAIDDFAKCFGKKQLEPRFYASLLSLRRSMADWTDDALLARLVEKTCGAGCAQPFVVLGVTDDPATQLAAARAYTEAPTAADAPPPRATVAGGRIRVAYVSADYRDHPTAKLIAPVFEHHDRSRFEVVGVALGPPDLGPDRKRIEAACDVFIDASSLSDEEVVKALRDKSVDIAVDMMVHTKNARPGIFSKRAAAVQVNYLAYPGTVGASWLDYLIADETVVPIGTERHFSERIVRLPRPYFPTPVDLPSTEPGPREAHGLPHKGFVFASFCATWKITPTVFDLWMGLLRCVPGSVLWLLEANEQARINLVRRAFTQSIDPERLIFAPRTDQPSHIGRHQLIDLCLDTFPYGGHTTTYDALYAGIPVVTLTGRSFASRVASTLLGAVGLSRLATSDPRHYVDVALQLAAAPDELRQIKQELAAAKPAAFDISAYCRDLETAFMSMLASTDRQRAGEGP